MIHVRTRHAVLFVLLCLSALPAIAQDAPAYSHRIGNPAFGEPGYLWTPSGIALHDGEIYVVEQTDKEVSVFTLDGTFQRSFGNANFSGTPQKIAVDAAGNCYVTVDDEHKVKKFDAAGAFVTEWGGYGNGDGQLNTPLGITIDPQGDVWVNDRFNYRFVEYDTDGNQLSATPRDAVNNTGATGIVFGPDGLIYATLWAADYELIRVFDTTGTPIRNSGFINDPQGIAIAPNGRVLTVSWSWRQALIFEAEGAMDEVVRWSSQGYGEDQLQYPADIAADTDGNIYVCDRNLKVVKVFTSSLVPTEKKSMGGVKGMFR